MIAPGFVQQFQSKYFIFILNVTISCPKCNGKGKIIKKKCHVCMGNKIVKGIEEMTVYIEKGMPNGYEIVREYFKFR
jgi:DnaJ-class molecular chaperone